VSTLSRTASAIVPEVPVLTENAVRVLRNRYLIRNEREITETPDEMFKRVADHVAGCEDEAQRDEWSGRFYELMRSGRFMPNSPTLMNSGRRMGLLSACFVLPVPDDTRGIFQAIKDTAIIQKAGGGTGFAFDELRPCGAFVSSSGGQSSGPIAFWRVFSEATSAIQQGSFRRGANMAMMRVNHPDIIKFLFAKQDLRQFENYNISVKVDDEFMELVTKRPGAPFIVTWPDREGDGWLIPKEIVERCRKAVQAGVASDGQPREMDICYGIQDLTLTGQAIVAGEQDQYLTVGDVMDLIVKNAWQTGEPGLFFIDRIRESEATPAAGLIQATNPCVTGDTQILTIDGPRSFEELVESGVGSTLVHAWDSDTKLPVIRMMRDIRRTEHAADIIEVEFDSGLKVRCTAGHNFRTFRGNKITAQDLRIGQSVRAYAVSRHRDGHQRAHAWVANRCAHQWVHRMALDCFGVEIPEGLVTDHIDRNPDNNRPENLRVMTPEEHNSRHYPEREAGGFGRHGWKTAAAEVHAKIADGVRRYYGDNHKVVAIRSAGRAAVYNGTVDDVHTYVIVDPEYRGDSAAGLWSGVVSCNCGEQPLMPNESCNLGSLNLGRYVRPFYIEHPDACNPDSLSADERDDLVDWDRLQDDICTSTRLLDNVVSVNRYPTENIERICHTNRKIGLGVMGFADALIRLGVRYDSEGGLRWGERFMKFVNDNAISASQGLAEERGAFENYEQSRWAARLDRPLRNACVTSVAPTGTISIIANASCGIEPLFSFVFQRQILGGETMMECHPDFAELAQQQQFDSPELQQHMFDNGTLQDAKKVPAPMKEIFRTARDVSPEWHVRMQAAFQRHTTSSISKTINMPHEATESSVREAYILAYASRCKGVTVYRNGCRANQPMALSKSSEQDEVLVVPDVPHFRVPVEIPEFMHATRTRYHSAYGNLHMQISLELTPDGRYRERELFFNLGRSGDGVHPMIEVFGRLASLILRLDGSLELVIEQMRSHVLGNHPSRNGSSNKATSPPNELAMALLSYFAKTQAFRDDDGFLTQLPDVRPGPNKRPEPVASSVVAAAQVSGGNGHGVERSQAFLDRVNSAMAMTGTYRVPCQTLDCLGELVWAEGCQKCSVCGEGACG
jgi:ribonucleoside-diphosphate reductase alpha chain